MSDHLRTALAGLVMLLPSIAQAELAAPETIIVTGHVGSRTIPSVADAEAALARVPGGVDLVAADAFADRLALSLRDMLALSPGLYIQPRYGEEVRLSIRGSGLGRSFHLRGVTLLQDGVPINLADGSGDFQELDPLVFQHLEVYRGATGLRHGAATLGGAINAVFPSGRTAASPHLLRLEGGSFGTRRGHAALVRAGETLDIYAAVTATRSNGYRAHADQSALRFTGNLGIRLSPHAETRFYLSLVDADQQVPGTLTLAQIKNAPRSSPPINIAQAYARDVRSLRLANKTAIDLGDGRLEFGGYLNAKSLYHPIFQVIDQDSRDWGGFARIEGGVSGLPLDYLLGANLRFGRVDAEQYLNLEGRRGALTADAVQKARTFDVHGELRLYPAKGLALIAGAQFLAARRQVDNRPRPEMSDARDYEELSPKLGLLWEPAGDVHVYANLSRGAEPPTFSELVQQPVAGFVPLRAQTGWTAEIGSRGRHGPLAWDISLYRGWLEGELLQFTTRPDVPAATFNAGDTRHQGLELGLDLALTDRLSLRQVYTLNDFRFRNDPEHGDNHLPGVPRHLYRAALGYAHPAGFTVTPHVEWVPRGAYADYRNSLRAGGYALVGVEASTRLGAGVTFFADARNLTGKRAVGSLSAVVTARPTSAIYYPVEGRSMFLGTRFAF